MVGVLRQAVGVNPVALRAYLDDEPRGGNQSAGAPRRRVNLPEGVEGAEEISHALLGVAMSRIASGEGEEEALALEIALHLNPNNSPAVILLTATYLLWGSAGEERGRTSAAEDARVGGGTVRALNRARRLAHTLKRQDAMPSSKKPNSPAPDVKIKLGDVAEYLGVSHRVIERLVKEGTIKPTRDPLDHRRKLVSTKQLDRLKQGSLKKD
jgi:hypothetical protein